MRMTDRPAGRYCCSTTARSTYPLIAFLLMALLSTASGVESSKDRNAVRVRRVQKAGYTSVVVENRRAYEVTVALTITAKNASVTRITSETATYPGYSQTEAARISGADPGASWRMRYDFHWTKGRMGAKHDGRTRYLLPFEKGQSHQVIQSYGGRLTHHGYNRYAIDFAMPEGTTVCAAREGVVVDLKESSTSGGPDKEFENQSNFVSVAHADGTIGEYHHLKRDGVLVKIGQRVTAGQPVALSGNTGYSTSPHVHFGVYSAADAKHLQSHPMTFTTGQGIVAKPIEGRVYTAK
jgi:murein DD-endopeptidase MepM/ murein hydrolase activator NlpD